MSSPSAPVIALSANEIEKMRAEASRLWAMINEAERLRSDQDNAKLVGRTFRYRNSYGSGEHWWLYGRIVGTEDGRVLMHTFETTSHGEIQISASHSRHAPLGDGWIEITAAEFDVEWRALLDRLSLIGARER